MDILWPSNLEGGGLPRSLMALLPNQNHNAEVLAALAAQPMAATRKIILPLFFCRSIFEYTLDRQGTSGVARPDDCRLALR